MQNPMQETGEDGEKTIMVTGQSLDSGDRDMCQYYFENQRRSGGGDITSINWDEERKCFFLTFVDRTAAKRVASREHSLKKNLLQVQLCQLPIPDRDAQLTYRSEQQLPLPSDICYEGKFSVSGVPPRTSAGYLQNCLEAETHVSASLSPEKDHCFVVLDSSDKEIDAKYVMKKKKYKQDGNCLHASLYNQMEQHSHPRLSNQMYKETHEAAELPSVEQHSHPSPSNQMYKETHEAAELPSVEQHLHPSPSNQMYEETHEAAELPSVEQHSHPSPSNQMYKETHEAAELPSVEQHLHPSPSNQMCEETHEAAELPSVEQHSHPSPSNQMCEETQEAAEPPSVEQHSFVNRLLPLKPQGQMVNATTCFDMTGGQRIGQGAASVQLSGNNIIAKFQVIPGHELLIIQGDITKCRVNAIVNITNKNLSRDKGVAGAIVKAGGNSVQRESAELVKKHGSLRKGQIAVTKAGTLPCSFVIHAVSPVWSGGHKGECELLHETVRNVLKKAEQMNLMSIALPAVCCGSSNFPVDLAINSIMYAIHRFFLDTEQECSLKTVVVIDMNAEPVNGFLHTAKSWYGQLIEVKKPARHCQNNTQQDTAQADSRCSYSDHGYDESHMPLKIRYGQIAKARADVIVCTIHPQLDMEIGVLSKSILKEGGDSIQQELMNFRKKYSTPQLGHVVYTSGGDLRCRNVFFLSLPRWHTDCGQKMRFAVIECLKEASKKRARSIAFPTLGTGSLGYPSDEVAIIMSSTIGQWFDKHRDSSLKEVQIIVFPNDTETVQTFSALKRQSGVRTGNRAISQFSGRRHDADSAVNSQEIPLPSHWDPMNGDDTKLVTLQPGSPEYKNVAGHIKQPQKIKKIDRIQNPTLYQLFEVKKRELERCNPKGTENKKLLFHGTSANNVKGIITHGFNRSFCGKNGTLFGTGVYFAVNSDISMGYTEDGKMFQARVLVGEYTHGNSSMRTPPLKPGSNRQYDSVIDDPSDPSIFVIFHDCQAYPQYLISF